MAARIALLVFVTGLFAAAWSCDHPPALELGRTPEPLKQFPYPDDPIRETALYRWKQNSDCEQVADAWEAARRAASTDDLSVRIDWLSIAGELQEEFAQAQRPSRTQPLWHRVTSSIARMLVEPQSEHSSIAAEPSEATRN